MLYAAYTQGAEAFRPLNKYLQEKGFPAPDLLSMRYKFHGNLRLYKPAKRSLRD